MTATYIGVDVGSSSVKAISVDASDGHVRAVGRGQFVVDRPTAGGWEFEPDALHRAAIGAIRALPEDERDGVVGLAVVGQMCGLIAVDREHLPVGPAIPIFDDRSIAETQVLDRDEHAHLTTHAMNGALSVYTLPKLMWLRDHRPEQFERTELVMLPKDYVRACLTDTWVTDPSDASGTLAFDQQAGSWDHELLRRLDLDASLWPEIRPSAEGVGRLSADAADLIGVRAGTPVAVGASDMAGVAFGVGVNSPEEMIVSFGTAAHVIAPAERLEEGIWPIQQFASATGGHFRFGAVYGGSVSAQWLLELLGQPEAFSMFEISSPPRPGSRVMFLPYLAGAGAPHEVPSAAGAFLGLRLGHDRTDLARAVIEGLCFELVQICRVHDPDGRRKVHVTGGGARLGPIVQVLADVLGREVHVAASLESAAVGAARLAAQAAGETGGSSAGFRVESGGVIEPRADDPDDLQTAFAEHMAVGAEIRALRPPSVREPEMTISELGPTARPVAKVTR